MVGSNSRSWDIYSRHTRRVLLLAGTAAWAACLFSGAAQAQTAASPAPLPMSAAQAALPVQGGLQEIVVTARKRAESTQNVPVAITALSSAQIQRYDLTSLERVAASTPQFTIGRAGTGSGATMVMRGIGSNTTSIGLEQSVAVVLDGVYYGQGRTINEGFFDLERIEILKGPQALFFGKNATAGVISMTTKDPGDKPEYLARVGYEFAGQELTGEAIASGPVTDTLGVRIAVRSSKMFGSLFDNKATDQTWRSFDVATGTTRFFDSPPGKRHPGERNILGRVTVKWKPTDRLTATLKASYNDTKMDNPLSNYVIYYCHTGKEQLNQAVPCGKTFDIYQSKGAAVVADSIPHGLENGALGDTYKSWSITGTLNYNLDHIAITSVTNYNWNMNIFRIDANAVASSPIGLYATEDTSYRAFSNETRVLTSFESPVNLMLGALYQSTKRDYGAWTAQAGLENSAASPSFYRYVGNSKDSQTKGETVAVFGQLIWKVVPQVEIAGGVRYTHETKDSYFIQPYSNPALVAAGVFAPGVRLTANQAFNNWSPEATVTWRPVRTVTVYAAYKTAYKSGGFSNSGIYGPRASVDDFAFNPETASGFEGGIKTELFDRQIRFNIDAYSYKYKNVQVDFFNSPVFAFTTTNAASVSTKGVEVELQYAPRALPGFEAHGTINYNKAEYSYYPDAPCWTGQTPAQGCFTTVPRPEQNLGGTPTAMAPRWTGSLGFSYEMDVMGGYDLALSADTRYSAHYLASAFGNPYSRQSAYATLDASIRLRTPDKRWEVALIGKNLTDVWYMTGNQDTPSTGGGTGTVNGLPADQIGYVSSPRTVQLQFTWHYD